MPSQLLLIDNSNTRTKFAVSSPGGLAGETHCVPTADLEEALVAKIAAPLAFDAAVICSVVPEKAALLRRALGSVPIHEISHRSDLPLGIEYPRPEQIGADRLANAAAVHARFGAPAVVVDFGTAVTFDVVGGDPANYLGGVIAPGLAAMTEHLHRRTALLPRIDLAEPRRAIGKSTSEAMQAGAVFGYRGLIREILRAVCEELASDPKVVATGGDAALIARGLPEVGDVLPGLTLEGIDLIGRRNL